jgi:hypothetical protein
VPGNSCFQCHATLRDDAAFCSACGAAQPAPEVDPRPQVALAIDVTTLKLLAVGARGLLRLRVDNRGARPIASLALTATWSGDALPAAEHGELAPSAGCELAIAVTPAIAGVHELAGELAFGGRRARFAGVHLTVGGSGPQVRIVHIDQSSARVVDNSRSSFGGGDAAGGLLGDGDWHPIELTIDEPAAPAAATAAPLPAARFSVTTERTTYEVTSTLARGDISTVYGGTAGDGTAVALKIADAPSDNDLMQHEARVLGLLVAEDHKTNIHFAQPRDQFRTGDGRLGSAFDRLDGLDLVAIRDRFRARGEPGLPARHVVWVMRRALAALGRAHQLGILHGNVAPEHVVVRGRDHMLWLVDWCWAVVNPAHTGQGFKALNDTYSAPEVAERGRPTPASDLYALGKTCIFVVGGDPATKTLPDGIDGKLARFIKYLCVESQGGRAQDAWELYLQLEKLREQIWGPHEFVPLEI